MVGFWDSLEGRAFFSGSWAGRPARSAGEGGDACRMGDR